jgi:putative alpha-1,2-mannosidase
MSAWYVYASIGMYPLVVGEAVYELFPPLFDKVTLHIGADSQTSVTICTEGRKGQMANAKCKKVTWNGKTLPDFRISHKQLKEGGELKFYF